MAFCLAALLANLLAGRPIRLFTKRKVERQVQQGTELQAKPDNSLGNGLAEVFNQPQTQAIDYRPNAGVFPKAVLSHKLILSLFFLILLCIPVIPLGPNRLSIAAILASVLGELSSLTVLLVAASFFDRWRMPRHRHLLLLPVLAGLTLYWSVLSYGPIDLYRLGYHHAATGPYGTMALLSALALSGFIMPIRLMFLLALACLSWSLGLQTSTNLWDYFLDLPSFLAYLGLLLASFHKRTFR